MRIEMLRMTRAWLIGNTYGVNAYIPTIPRDGGDAAPPVIPAWTDPITFAVEKGVFEETSHSWVTNREPPPVSPAIYLMVEGAVELSGDPTPDGQIRETTSPTTLIARYIAENSDIAVAKRDGEYTLRALLRSMRELMKNANFADRSRNNVHIIRMTDPAIYLPVVEGVGNFMVTGALVVNLSMRDSNPSF